MRGQLPVLAVAGVALASLVATTALAADEPPQVRGASYSFLASSARASGSGKGALGAELELGGSGTLRVSRGSARVDARVRSWQVTLHGEQVTLVLRVETRETAGGTSCPVGSRGIATLVDDPEDPANDRVRVAFASTRCAAFSRSWSQGGGQSAKVRIKLAFTSA